MRELTCILCPSGCQLQISKNNGEWIVNGNLCARGEVYAVDEMINPQRIVCSTIKTIYPAVPRLPVKTSQKIPKENIFPVMKVINQVRLDHPVRRGEVIVANVLGTDADIVATADLYYLLEEEGING